MDDFEMLFEFEYRHLWNPHFFSACGDYCSTCDSETECTECTIGYYIDGSTACSGNKTQISLLLI